MIPKVIHQACHDPSALPRELRESIDGLRARNPRWEHRLYGREDMLQHLGSRLVEDEFRLVKRLNPNYPGMLTQVFRYVVGHREGGVYLSITSGATRPLDEVLRGDDRYLLSQWANRLGEEYPGWGSHKELSAVPGGEYQTWHIVAAPGHAYLEAVIAATLQNIRTYRLDQCGAGGVALLRLCGGICYTLAIDPIRDKHPRRILDIRGIGFVASFY